MLSTMIARLRLCFRRAYAAEMAEEFTKTYGALVLTNHYTEDGDLRGYTVDWAPDRIAIAPELLDTTPRDEDGLLVFAALNGTWRYRINGEVRLSGGPTVVLAALASQPADVEA